MAEFICPHCHAVFKEHKTSCPNDGSFLIEVPVLTDLSGRVLKQKYKLEEALGHGGFGSVYKAIHLILGKTVAVKVLRAEFRNDSKMVARFFTEARVVTRLSNPHTITTFDLDQAEDGFLFMVMDYVTGRTLRKVAQEDGNPPGRLEWRRVLRLLSQVCESLDEAHRAGVVHRDLKPDNVMVSNRGGQDDFVTVLDFGIAKVVEGADSANLTTTGMLLGSPAYMSPEQVKGGAIGPASDIYSLGVMAYQVLSGALPTTARQTAAILQEKLLSKPVPIRKKAPDVELPVELEALVMSMLEAEPSNRPASAAQVRESFSRILADYPEGVGVQEIASARPRLGADSAAPVGTQGYQDQLFSQSGQCPANAGMEDTLTLPGDQQVAGEAGAPPRGRPSAPSSLPQAVVQPTSAVEVREDEPLTQVSSGVSTQGSRRKLLFAVGSVAALLVLAAIGLGVGITLNRRPGAAIVDKTGKAEPALRGISEKPVLGNKEQEKQSGSVPTSAAKPVQPNRDSVREEKGKRPIEPTDQSWSQAAPPPSSTPSPTLGGGDHLPAEGYTGADARPPETVVTEGKLSALEEASSKAQEAPAAKGAEEKRKSDQISGGEAAEEKHKAPQVAAAKAEEKKRKAEEAAAKAEEKKRKAEEAAAETEEKKRKAEEAAAKAEEKKRKAAKAAPKAREKKREAEEAAAKAEEKKRKAEEAAAKAEEKKRKPEEEAAKAAEEKRKAEEEKRKAEEERETRELLKRMKEMEEELEQGHKKAGGLGNDSPFDRAFEELEKGHEW